MNGGRRVVVTGVGLVSPLAIGTQANWAAILAGKSGIGPITRFDASRYSARIAGEVQGFDPLQFVEKKDVKKSSSSSRSPPRSSRWTMHGWR